MPNHTEIYNAQVEKYDLLISKQPNLLGTIQSICPLEGLIVIDIGAGTGRLTVPMAQVAKSVLALDSSAEMLKVAAHKLARSNLTNWHTRVCDHRAIDAPNHSADVIVSGWSICYIASSNVDNWETNLDEVMKEFQRTLRPGGIAIILENMGTGSTSPSPPDFLQGYFSLLEHKYGFEHTWIRTDYHFDRLEEAIDLTNFFFGSHLSDIVAQNKLLTLHECAGIWWRRF